MYRLAVAGQKFTPYINADMLIDATRRLNLGLFYKATQVNNRMILVEYSDININKLIQPKYGVLFDQDFSIIPAPTTVPKFYYSILFERKYPLFFDRDNVQKILSFDQTATIFHSQKYNSRVHLFTSVKLDSSQLIDNCISFGEEKL